jgi:tetratricopeptide (TPR) repeat protein
MLIDLLSNLRRQRQPPAKSQEPTTAAVESGTEGRAALQSWIRWDRLPPFDIADLTADPARARAAEMLAMSVGEREPETILRALLAVPDPQAVDRLLLAEVLLRRGDGDGAAALLRQIDAFSPPLRARAACINGQLDFNRGDFAAARRWTDIALAWAPHAPAVQTLSGSLLDAEGRHREAETQFRRMLAVLPDDFGARINLALSLHSQGRIADGLHEQVTAETIVQAAGDAKQLQIWDGRPLQQGSILVTINGGIGDILQNLRYAQRLRAQAPHARLVLWTRAEIVQIARLTGCFDEVLSDPALDISRFDWRMPLINLALQHFLDENRPDFTHAYIQCDPGRVEAMRLVLQSRLHETSPHAGARSLRVGLRWSGAAASYDARRSVPPERLLPLLRLPGISWVALLERGHEQLSWLAARGVALTDVSQHLADLADTAALMMNLDLVISVDTSVAHLAGALGARTWLLSRPDADPRWGKVDAQSDLYASVRLFRHPGRLDWDQVVADVAGALARLVGQAQGHGA